MFPTWEHRNVLDQRFSNLLASKESPRVLMHEQNGTMPDRWQPFIGCSWNPEGSQGAPGLLGAHLEKCYSRSFQRRSYAEQPFGIIKNSHSRGLASFCNVGLSLNTVQQCQPLQNTSAKLLMKAFTIFQKCVCYQFPVTVCNANA